jgi:hypothetical protein
MEKKHKIKGNSMAGQLFMTYMKKNVEEYKNFTAGQLSALWTEKKADTTVKAHWKNEERKDKLR